MNPTAEHTQQVLTTDTSGPALRNLYVARFGFALVWAGLLATSASSLSGFTVTLLVIYPLVDLVSAALDLRRSPSGTTRMPLLVNIALSLLASIGLAIAGASTIPDVLRVWSAWAVLSGLAQLAVAVRRRQLGGQWPLILSGGISVLAGAGFTAMASGDDPALGGLAGYAALGGLFFGISAARLHRRRPAPAGG